MFSHKVKYFRLRMSSVTTVLTALPRTYIAGWYIKSFKSSTLRLFIIKGSGYIPMFDSKNFLGRARRQRQERDNSEVSPGR